MTRARPQSASARPQAGAEAIVTGTLRTTLPTRPVSAKARAFRPDHLTASEPASHHVPSRRTYLSRIKEQQHLKLCQEAKIKRLELELENERACLLVQGAGSMTFSDQTGPLSLEIREKEKALIAGYAPVPTPNKISPYFAPSSVSSALERRFSELECRMKNTQSCNQRLTVQLEEERNARIRAEKEIARLKERLETAERKVKHQV